MAAEMLECVRRRDAADLRAHASYGQPSAMPFIRPPRKASPTPVGSTIRCGVTAGTSDAPPRDDGRPVFALGHDERAALREDGLLARPGLLLQDLVLVVIADDDRGADDAVAQFVPDIRAHCCPGSKMNADAERAAFLGVLDHGAGSFGEMIASPQSATS